MTIVAFPSLIMSLTTHKLLNKEKERDCVGMTYERKYYHTHDVFIKRSLRRDEWKITHQGTIHVPRLGPERLLNEAAAMRFVAEKTSIPVPRLICCFEDDNVVYVIQEYVKGVSMANLKEEQKETVKAEICEHLERLHSLRSARVGAADPRSGLIIPPLRALRALPRDDWTFPDVGADEYVFCHNDLSQNNVIVDPDTLQINAIIDWEYAGFWPPAFDLPFYERPGPSVAQENELDDSDAVVQFFWDNSVR